MDSKPWMQNKFLIIVGVIGIACLLFGSLYNRAGGHGSAATLSTSPDSASGGASPPASPTPAKYDPASNLENAYDEQLTSMLKRMAGVRDVSVMVTMNSTEGLELAQNSQQTTQTQSDGKQTTSQSTTTRNDIFTERTSNGDSVPFVTQHLAPKVRGVLVMVDADDFFVAKANIIDAIRHVLDVPAYKISVEPEKSHS